MSVGFGRFNVGDQIGLILHPLHHTHPHPILPRNFLNSSVSLSNSALNRTRNDESLKFGEHPAHLEHGISCVSKGVDPLPMPEHVDALSQEFENEWKNEGNILCRQGHSAFFRPFTQPYQQLDMPINHLWAAVSLAAGHAMPQHCAGVRDGLTLGGLN